MQLLRTADDVLRRAAWTVADSGSAVAIRRVLGCVLVYGAFYGAAMGLYRGVNGQSDWVLQAIYSAAKAPLLIVSSFAISLPAFFVLSTLLGLRSDFVVAVRGLVSAQATMAITLAALAPVTLLFYVSTGGYQEALLFNGAVFAVASAAGQLVLRAHFRPLIERRPRHRTLLSAWGAAYVFVAIQLAWLLRPFIGSSGERVTFFRAEAWDNAYVVVGRLVWRVLADR